MMKHRAYSQEWAEFFGLSKSIAIFLAIAFMLRASVVEAFKIPSSSMEDTLQVGDHILVNKLSYGFRLPFIKETLSSPNQMTRQHRRLTSPIPTSLNV